MVSPFLAKLFSLILETKSSESIEYNNNTTKQEIKFMNQHATINHLAMLRIIYKFIDFKVIFDTIPRSNL